MDADSEQPLYWFGVSGREYTLCKIVRLESPETHKIRITAVPYDERIYAYEDATAPAIDFFYEVPSDPSAPVVTGLTVTPYPGSISEYVASWAPALGAQSYIVSKSLDGINYVFVDRVTVANCVFTVEPGDLWVKVYAVNTGAGPAATWTGTVGSATVAPDGVIGLALQEEFTGEDMFIEWGKNDLATQYSVQFYLGATLIHTKTTTATSTFYSLASATNHAALASVPLGRAIGVSVRAENAIGEGPYCDTEVFTNPVPDAPSLLSVGSPAGTVYPVSWQHSYEDDLKEFNVYFSTVDGFTPGPGNLVATVEAPANEASIDTAVSGFWRVSSVDKWGTEEAMSAQAVIP